MSMQNKKERINFSQLRQSLTKIPDEIRQLIGPYFSDKPFIKGSVYELKRKCGKPRCKCALGELHGQMVVSSSEKGKTKLRVIPHGFLVEREISKPLKHMLNTKFKSIQDASSIYDASTFYIF